MGGRTPLHACLPFGARVRRVSFTLASQLAVGTLVATNDSFSASVSCLRILLHPFLIVLQVVVVVIVVVDDDHDAVVVVVIVLGSSTAQDSDKGGACSFIPLFGELLCVIGTK